MSLRSLGAVLLAGASPAPLLAQDLVVEAGRVIPVTGPEIEDGVIVIQGGRIRAIGPADEVERPWDLPVIGGPELTAFPGFVEAHTTGGLDRSNESVDVAPYLDVRDAIDPVAFYFEESLRWGVTTLNVQQGHQTVISGRGRIVQPVGATVEEMTVRPAYGFKVSLEPKSGKSRATQLQALRGAFLDLRRHLEELVALRRAGDERARREALYQGRELEGERAKGRAMEGSGWKVEGLEIVPRGEIDEKQEPLLELVEGRADAFLYCGAPVDVSRAVAVARENGFLERSTLVIDPACWKAADELAAAARPVILDGELWHVERDPVTGEERETFVPKVLERAGVRFALSSENGSDQSLWYQAALAVGGGIERQRALESVTTIPAEILGLADEVGGLAPGMQGDVLLLSGDPLSVTTWVEHVVLGGREVYDRRSDPRTRHLLEGVVPPNTQPAPATIAPLGDDGEPLEPGPEAEAEDADEGDAPARSGDGSGEEGV